jgi:hypothetical protein
MILYDSKGTGYYLEEVSAFKSDRTWGHIIRKIDGKPHRFLFAFDVMIDMYVEIGGKWYKMPMTDVDEFYTKPK